MGRKTTRKQTMITGQAEIRSSCCERRWPSCAASSSSVRSVFCGLDANAERLEKTGILGINLQLRSSGRDLSAVSNQLWLVRFFIAAVESNGSFEDEENVIAFPFNSSDHVSDRFGLRERFVDGLSKFLH